MDHVKHKSAFEQAQKAHSDHPAHAQTIVCLWWGLTAQSTQWGHVERGQFT